MPDPFPSCRALGLAPGTRISRLLTTLLLTAFLGACAPGEGGNGEAGTGDETGSAEAAPSALASSCAPDDGGITLPEGFCAIVAHEGVGRARHLDVRDDGDVFVAVQDRRRRNQPAVPGGVVALRDADGDGAYEVEQRWGGIGTNEALLDGEHLYVAPNDGVLRYRIPDGSLTPEGGPDTLVSGLPADRSHAAKSVALGGDGSLYVNIGAPSNTCMVESRTQGSPGMDPCPELETRGGIWRFDSDITGQSQGDGDRFATGLRNVVALAIHPAMGQLYGVQHGRDQLHDFFPERYTVEENAELPSEELFAIDAGDDFGWPYCYHDWQKGQKLLAPEYGGDGETVGRCADAEDPLVAFPGHWAPNDLAFYTEEQFPGRYRDGAFVAFHGSWNRAPLPQDGYNVVFVPFEGGRPTGEWEIFADGFRPDPPGGDEAGADEAQPDPEGFARPVGVAVAPDGSLLIIDSLRGKLWRIVYRGTQGT